MQRIITLLIVVGIVVAGYMAWQHMNKPLTPGERLDNAMGELQNGNLGNAVDEASAQTPAERLENSVNNAVDNAQGQ